MSKYYKADLVCFRETLLDLKAASKITNDHKVQILNYLAAMGLKLGLLINFHAFQKAEIIRIVR
jgi:GxxExxY protein